MKFRKKPVVIEAIQWTGTNMGEIGEFMDGIHWAMSGGNLVIPTLEGDMAVSLNDWIIRGVKGEYYPCKPDVFEATYEPEDARQTFPGHADTIGKIAEIINERLRPDNLDVRVAPGTANTYNIQVSSRSTGPRWSFWLRMDNGQIRDFDGEGGSWDAARDRTEWLMSTVTALRQKGIQNFYMHVEEL
jgi:hypothetical protein